MACMLTQPTRWDALDDLKYQDEATAVHELLAAQPLSPVERATIVADAIRMVEAARHLALFPDSLTVPSRP